MLNYIKEQLAAKAAAAVQETTAVDPAEVSSELLLEYAPVMEGLDDLTLTGDGTDNADRPIIAIPLEPEDEELPDIAGLSDKTDEVENDPEIGSLEVDLSTGNMMDVPMDANIQAEYATMKTMANFIKEGYELIDPVKGQTPEEYDAVVKDSAKKNFIEYRNQVLQEQAFGFTKKSIKDESIAPAIIAEFDTNVSAFLEPTYQVDAEGNVRNKQLESVEIMGKHKHFSRFEPFIESFLINANLFNRKTDGSVWDKVRPVTLNVPIDPIDKHSVIVGFKNVADLGKSFFVRCSVPVTNSNAEPVLEFVLPNTIERMNKVSSTKTLFQEAIDLGVPEGANVTDASAASAPAPTATDTPAAAPAADAPAATDPAAMSTDTPDASAPAPDAAAAPAADDKTVIPIETNNVSDQIAQKVATDTDVPDASQNADAAAAEIDKAADTADALPDLPDAPGATDDLGTGDPALDAGATDPSLESDPSLSGDMDSAGSDTDINVGVDDNNPDLDADTQGSVDDKLNELDEMGATGDTGMEAGVGDMSADPTDIGNMSVDEMIQAATDKIKGMPINAIQQFLSGNSSLQESFVMEGDTNENINKELDENLRSCLGILNDDELSFKGIENRFKKNGKQLNSILSKAAKNDLYSDDEKEEINKFNSSLTDLMVHFTPTKKEDVESTKKKIMTFTAGSKRIDSIINRHKSGDAKASKDTGKE